MEACDQSHCDNYRRANMVEKEQNESHLSVGSWDDQLDVEEQTSLVEHQQQQEEDSR
jgi:hypothetical protein